jgi:hypothetical protein
VASNICLLFECAVLSSPGWIRVQSAGSQSGSLALTTFMCTLI